MMESKKKYLVALFEDYIYLVFDHTFKFIVGKLYQ
jgi:hypothetical protein